MSEMPKTGRTMPNDEFSRLRREIFDRCNRTSDAKSGEYGGAADRLLNFRYAAADNDCTLPQAVSGQLSKHLGSLHFMINSGERFPVERWQEKITDAINYIVFLEAAVIVSRVYDHDPAEDEPIMSVASPI